jgi:ketosteroid isomerase-like protein
MDNLPHNLPHNLPDERAEVLAVERQWTAAHLHGDVAAIERIMAEEYIRIQPDGSVAGKAAVLAAYQPDRRHWDHAQGDEYDVRIYGNTALVVGRWTARGVNNGQAFDYAARFLSVYVRRNGDWQMVAEQSTEIR